MNKTENLTDEKVCENQSKQPIVLTENLNNHLSTAIKTLSFFFF